MKSVYDSSPELPMSRPSKISSSSLRWNWLDRSNTARKSSMEISPLLAMSAFLG